MTVTERRLAAILSADVVGYSRLMAEDQDETVRTIGAYREQVELLVRQHRGRVVDFTGDNFLAEFPTAFDAVQSGVEIQRVLASRNADLADDRKMEFRIGIHLGDIQVEGERIYGDAVYFSRDRTNPVLVEHLANGGRAAALDGSRLVILDRDQTVDLLPLDDVPTTDLDALLGAIAALYVSGVSIDTLKDSLRSFRLH